MRTHLLYIRSPLPIVREYTQNEMARRLLAVIVTRPMELQFLMLEKTMLICREDIRLSTHLFQYELIVPVFFEGHLEGSSVVVTVVLPATTSHLQRP